MAARAVPVEPLGERTLGMEFPPPVAFQASVPDLGAPQGFLKRDGRLGPGLPRTRGGALGFPGPGQNLPTARLDLERIF